MSNLSQFINNHFARYDLSSLATTATLDLSRSNVFRIDATAPRTLTFANPPAAGRAMAVILYITGSSAIVWPAGIDWLSGSQPKLGAASTLVTLLYDGTKWVGPKESKK